MASQRKPSGNKLKLPEMEILPQLFTPNKARRAHNWLRSGKYNYDEKIAVLKSLWSKEEERQATDKVLKDSFNPKVVPRVRIWLNEAKADEKKAVMKLFRSMANQNPSQKTSPNQENTSDPPRPAVVASVSTKDSDVAKPGTIQSKKVTWKNLHTSKKTTGRLIPLAPLRTEFDIAPDWRAPKRIVVPMTQVPREDQGKDRLPNLTKQVCHRGRNEREFVIHPEWIIH